MINLGHVKTLPFSLLLPRPIYVTAVKPPIVEGIAPNPNTHIPQNTIKHNTKTNTQK